MIVWRLARWCVYIQRLNVAQSLKPVLQLHVNQGHSDLPIREHVQELISKLEELDIKPSPEDGGQDDDDDWEDCEESDSSNSDVEMS